ncbi:LapD/MoxY N-terminal periplasmic domain-containing protein [Alkalilimnicola ehrlichii]|uniref:LapD/MoxY N-terminal periplasmic domain-containing protein n=1 Tax=Alkalilimnicola ehrlichii TaxID=351052 RepID=UPI003BA0D0CA
MPLRLRLSLLITLLTAAFLLAGVFLVVNAARHDVRAELHSATSLTAELLQASIEAMGEKLNRSEVRDAMISGLTQLGGHRHIEITAWHGDNRAAARAAMPPARTAGAPDWFIRLVTPEMQVLYREVSLGRPDLGGVIIRAEPADEITEAWGSTRTLLLLLLTFAVAANALMYWLLGRALRPLGHILKGLDALQRGRLESRLPRFRVHEFDRVSRHFNSMADSLATSHQRIQRLNRRLFDVQEAERHTLARELHDELGQCLVAIRADAMIIANAPDAPPANVRASADAIRDTAGHVYQLTRRIMGRLHPAALEQLGLGPALRQMAGDWARRHPDIAVAMEIQDTPRGLPPSQAIHLYRVVQEGLTNVTKHAHARRVRLRLRDRGEHLWLVIGDDGHGLGTRRDGDGMGLMGMAERIQGLGGRLRCFSGPTGGTTLVAAVPLPTTSAPEPVARPGQRPHAAPSETQGQTADDGAFSTRPQPVLHVADV